ncbi:TfoX/Sxy family protein [Aureimonas ureilytica]|uniref:TfoX/Sxy family protein n=1 Tax=Aureimonas ureilytica TaxID=401562 RepID=UPI00037FCFB7|nr:TfoX/Sxy family protein [Aureimonas ureilytica]
MDEDHIAEMFEGLGPVTIRRMFGGKGVYHAGLIVAVDFRDEILLKADATSAPLFAEAGARQWTYEGQTGRPVLMPYWSIPDEALDDPEALAHWVRLAFEAALRAGAAKPPRRRKAPSAL